jgi:hypothetical protein
MRLSTFSALRRDLEHLLSWFHARCRSFFWLHNQHSRLLGGNPVESLQSHCNHTQFSGPVVHPFASCHEGPGSNPQGVTYVCETGILLLVLSCYRPINNRPINTWELGRDTLNPLTRAPWLRQRSTWMRRGNL